MLMPKRSKFRKQQRGRMRGKAYRGCNVDFGDFGLKALEPAWITSRQIEAARVAMTRAAQRGGKVLLRKTDEGLDPADRQLADALMRIYEESGFASPRPDELPALLRAAPDCVERILAFLCDEGRLVRLSKNVVLCYNYVRKAQESAIAVIQEHGVLDSADFKRHIGSTRKYALAILDYLDARRITVRHGNHRKLAANYQERLL